MEVHLRLRLPSESRFVPLLRTTAARFLVDLGVSRTDIDDVQLILTEACANVVRHATGTTAYRVDVGVRADGCTIAVTDDGPGFDPEEISAPDATAEHGRGLSLMDALADELTFRSLDEGGQAVMLEKRWADPLDAPEQIPDGGARGHSLSSAGGHASTRKPGGRGA